MSVQRTFSGAKWETIVAYCRAIKVGSHIYISGTAPVDENGGVFAPNDGYQQAKRCFEIIQNSLQSLGVEMSAIVRTRMFVTDISRWQEFAQAHQEVFADNPPTTSMVEVKALIDPAMLIEVEAEAVCAEIQSPVASEIKQPAECKNLQNVREAIDCIDTQIIHLLSERFEYVKAAAKFKETKTDVEALDRVQAMLKQRRIWAESEGLSPDVIEKLYQDLIQYFTEAELQHHQTTRSQEFEP
jgi:chorismate mutase-like protein